MITPDSSVNLDQKKVLCLKGSSQLRGLVAGAI